MLNMLDAHRWAGLVANLKVVAIVMYQTHPNMYLQADNVTDFQNSENCNPSHQKLHSRHL